MSSSGISFKKRLGIAADVEPNTVRLHACDMYKYFRARVIPT
jgi:hypothetical protein